MNSPRCLVPGDRFVPWDDAVKKGWPLVPLATVAGINQRVLPETTPPDRPIRYVDISSVDSKGTIAEVADFTFESAPSRARRVPVDGDTIISTVRTYLKAVAFMRRPERHLVCSTGFAVLSPKPAMHPRFLFYWVLSDHFVDEVCARSVGVSYPALRPSEMANLPVAVPPFTAQRAIADFLDRKTAAIDALIARKAQSSQLLRERRQSLIDTVTADAHGPEMKLAYLADLLPGFAFPSEGFRTEGVRLLRGVNLGVGEVRWEDTVFWSPEDQLARGEFNLREGDVVFGMDRPWIGAGLRVATVGAGDVPCLLLQRVARLRARAGLLQEYMRILLDSTAFRAYFEPILSGVSVPHISGNQILGFRFRLPSVEVQQRAIDAVSKAARLQRDVEQRLVAQVDALREYRLALISETVTGRLVTRELRQETAVDG